MRVAVTGGGGFLGKEIVFQLKKRGDVPVVLGRNIYPKLQRENIECFVVDLGKTTDLKPFLKGCDAVIHTAAKAGIYGPKQEFYLGNFVATQNVLKACCEMGIRMVYTSSPSVIFNGKDMEGVDENTPYPDHYDAWYPKTKAMAEQLVLNQNEIPVCSLRPHLIWGIGDNHLVPRFVSRGRQGRIRIIGNGQNLVDTVWVEDAARAHLLALDRLEKGSPLCSRSYFISQNEPVFLFEWIYRILESKKIKPATKKVSPEFARILGGFLEFIWPFLPVSSEPPMTRFLAGELATAHWFNLERARKDLDYQPSMTMEECYQKLFASEWFQKL